MHLLGLYFGVSAFEGARFGWFLKGTTGKTDAIKGGPTFFKIHTGIRRSVFVSSSLPS